MKAFTLIFTEAGRAALINAAQTGTNKHTVTHAGVTDQVFTANAGMTALPGEIKRIDAVSGAAIAPDQISLAILDTSADAYSVTGFGLYLEDGTLLAIYSQDDPFLVKTEFSFGHIQADLTIKDASIKPEDIQFGGLEFLNPIATETMEGVARIATQAEANSGTDDTTIMTPKKVAQVLRTPGEVGMFCFATPPKGWLLADGTAVSRTTHARLFAAIGTTFGQGNGSSTFNLPDLRGEFIRGADFGRGVDAGRTLGSAQEDAIRNIQGSIRGGLATVAGDTGGDGAFKGSTTESNGLDYTNGTRKHVIASFDASKVVPTATENRPRNIALAMFIFVGA